MPEKPIRNLRLFPPSAQRRCFLASNFLRIMHSSFHDTISLPLPWPLGVRSASLRCVWQWAGDDAQNVAESPGLLVLLWLGFQLHHFDRHCDGRGVDTAGFDQMIRGLGELPDLPGLAMAKGVPAAANKPAKTRSYPPVASIAARRGCSRASSSAKPEYWPNAALLYNCLSRQQISALPFEMP